MTRISWKDRWRLPDYRHPDQVTMGRVDFEHGQCRSCGLCVLACPASAIIMVDKKTQPGPEPRECIFCGDCLAICPAEAVMMVSPLRLAGHFKTVDRGPALLPRLDFEPIQNRLDQAWHAIPSPNQNGKEKASQQPRGQCIGTADTVHV